MVEHIADKFVDALAKLESDGDLNTIAGLFSDDSEIGNVTLSKTLSGVNGAREFWRSYKDTLGDVRSTFKNKIYTDDTAALEWTTDGKQKSGNQVSYEGVSIIETDGKKITRFFAYFDPVKLGNEIGGRNGGKS